VLTVAYRRRQCCGVGGGLNERVGHGRVLAWRGDSIRRADSCRIHFFILVALSGVSPERGNARVRDDLNNCFITGSNGAADFVCA
jgi:hypothetical protein